MIRARSAACFPATSCSRRRRIIRDSDIEIEEEAEDLIRYFRSAIKRRRRGRVIRLELGADMPDDLVALVAKASTPARP